LLQAVQCFSDRRPQPLEFGAQFVALALYLVKPEDVWLGRFAHFNGTYVCQAFSNS